MGWIVLALGGFGLTLLGAGVGSQLVLLQAVPGPAEPYALATIGIAGLSLLVSTTIMGIMVGVRTLSQWLRALAAVAALVAGSVALIAFTIQPS